MNTENNPDKLLLQQLLSGQQMDCHHTGNPLAAAMQLHVEEISLEKIVLSFQINELFTQGHGVIQGGILSAMLDFGAAFIGLINTAPNKSVVTSNLSINYLRAAPAGEYYVEAVLEKVGNKMVFSQANLYQYAGKNIATAMSSMVVV